MTLPRSQVSKRHHNLGLSVLLLGLLVIGISSRCESGAGTNTRLGEDDVRQLTVFAVIATPGVKTADSNLTRVYPQLAKLLPDHGFKLLDVESKSIMAGECVSCMLSNGYTLETTLAQSMDENGKVELRCTLLQNNAQQISTLVKTPPSQLFFCQHILKDGTRLLIGVGAR